MLVVGAGPAGSVAATILARAGARVRLVDRATFPAAKLCGDTVNPGTLARAAAAASSRRHRRARACASTACWSPATRGVAIEGRYPERHVRARDPAARSRLDAAAAGDRRGREFEPGVRRARARSSRVNGTRFVGGALAGAAAASGECRACDDRRRRPRSTSPSGSASRVTPASAPVGGRRSTSTGVERADIARRDARAARLLHRCGAGAGRPARTSVWCGRRGPATGAARPGGAASMRALSRRSAAPRSFAACAPRGGAASSLGPLAVESTGASIDGLLLAGDAAGFIDPMTGDGLRFAVRGGELAAAAALEALQRGWSGVHARLDAARRRGVRGEVALQPRAPRAGRRRRGVLPRPPSAPGSPLRCSALSSRAPATAMRRVSLLVAAHLSGR